MNVTKTFGALLRFPLWRCSSHTCCSGHLPIAHVNLSIVLPLAEQGMGGGEVEMGTGCDQ